MHPVLGTMMPKICEAPHLPISRFQPSCRSELNEWGAFISFSCARRVAGTKKPLNAAWFVQR